MNDNTILIIADECVQGKLQVAFFYAPNNREYAASAVSKMMDKGRSAAS